MKAVTNDIGQYNKSLNIEQLPLSDKVKEFYIKSGIITLHPPQTEVIKAGLLDNNNIVAAIPTASGKTLLAEFAMLKTVLDKNQRGKALYVVPLVALASEKYDKFKKFQDIKYDSGAGISVGISTGEYESRSEWLGSKNIIVVTSEKIDSLIRNKAGWIKNITVLVVDEIHLIDSFDRGPTIEMVIAKFMRINPKMQIVALSATIRNAGEIAQWLNAQLVTSTWRPVELKEGVFYENTIYFDKDQRNIAFQYEEPAVALAVDVLKDNGQCLIFESNRKSAEKQAKIVGVSIQAQLTQDEQQKLNTLASKIKETMESKTTEELVACIKNSTSWHHAGLIQEQRKLIEDGFRDGTIKVLVATPTLAAGINMPARRVIVKGYMRYDRIMGYSKPIPVLEYKQMAGRAGRPKLDPYGESVLIAKTEDDLDMLMNKFVKGTSEKITSKLDNIDLLRMHILATVATGFAKSIEELDDLFNSTFYCCQQDKHKLIKVVNESIDFLLKEGMITNTDGLYATSLGEIVSRVYIDPVSASIIVKGLKQINEKKIEFTDVTLAQLICETPDVNKSYISSKNRDMINIIWANHKKEFINILKSKKSDKEGVHSDTIGTVAILLDWMNEIKEVNIAEGHKIGEGDVRSLVEKASWLAFAMKRISQIQSNNAITQKIGVFEKRINNGIRAELAELVQIKNISRIRARKLFDAGYKTISMVEVLNKEHPEKIKEIIGRNLSSIVPKHITKSKLDNAQTSIQDETWNTKGELQNDPSA